MATAGPPPLKRKGAAAPPLPKRGPRKVDDDDEGPVLVLPDDVLRGAPARDDDPSAGEWLFKDGDVVKGPVAAGLLVEAIDEGTVDGDTPIAREIGKWRPLREVTYFNAAVDAASERRRVEEELRVEKARRRRRNVLRAVVVVFFAIGPFVGGVVAGRTLMIARPWDDTDTWLRRLPPLVDLPPRAKPVVVAHKDPPPADPAPPVDEPDDPAGENDDDRPDPRGKKGKKDKKDKRDKKDAKDGKKPDEKPAADPGVDQGTFVTLNQDQVKAGMQKGFNGFKGCIKAEFDKKTDLPPRITVAFSIANDGRAIEVKLLERQVRESALADCIRGVMGGLRWPKFTGERRYVEWPFNIGPKK